MEQIKKEISEYSEGEVLRILSKNVDGFYNRLYKQYISGSQKK